MKNFEHLFQQHQSRFSSKWQHYFAVYDRFFSRFINQKFTLLEIGVSLGGSLQLWKKYFGSHVSVIGIDNNSQSYFEESQIQIFIGDQTDKKFLENVLNTISNPAIIIDDGSHIQSHILKTFEILYPALSDNGIYVIEDCHTAYWPRFEGGVNSHLNVVDIFSRSAHDVNSKWYNVPKTVRIPQLDSISFHDSMIILEKRQKDYKRNMVEVDRSGPRIRDTI